MDINKLQEDLDKLLKSHPLLCDECDAWIHASEVICEDCKIAIIIENSSILGLTNPF